MTKKILDLASEDNSIYSKFQVPKFNVDNIATKMNSGDTSVNINGLEININEPVDGNNVMDVVRKHIKDIASDVGNEFSKNVNRAGTRKSWG